MSEEKKIIIDEDWKSRVQAEKEAAQQESQPGAEPPADPAAARDDQTGGEPMPPATFELLVSSLATEALIALGQIPHPVTGEVQPQPHLARYMIDMLDVLREKTAGNLSPQEDQVLEQLLHQLRMAFVGSATGGDAPARPTQP